MKLDFKAIIMSDYRSISLKEKNTKLKHIFFKNFFNIFWIYYDRYNLFIYLIFYDPFQIKYKPNLPHTIGRMQASLLSDPEGPISAHLMILLIGSQPHI
jgi:hypothetical protein